MLVLVLDPASTYFQSVHRNSHQFTNGKNISSCTPGQRHARDRVAVQHDDSAFVEMIKLKMWGDLRLPRCNKYVAQSQPGPLGVQGNIQNIPIGKCAHPFRGTKPPIIKEDTGQSVNPGSPLTLSALWERWTWDWCRYPLLVLC